MASGLSCTSIDAGFAPGQLLHHWHKQAELSQLLFKQLIDYLASKSMLLIIDNFEHLADQGS